MTLQDGGEQANWRRPFAFAHVGDLHLTNMAVDRGNHLWRRQARLRSDLKQILRELNSFAPDRLDFVYLPGDIAENGCANEYRFLKRQLRRHPHKVKLIPGDHDRALGSLDDFEAFRATVAGMPGPRTESVERFLVNCPPHTVMTHARIPQFFFCEDYVGVRCIFLDVVSAGYGRKGLGLDFRLGSPQIEWLAATIDEARNRGLACVVFMHCYPYDLADPDERTRLAGLFWRGEVRLVEMGHTHYNELAPDGRTLYATARSVGQNEDGAAGYAIAAIDHTSLHGLVTSWRFKQVQLGSPFVLITSPADRRLATEALRRDWHDRILVRALAFTDLAHSKLKCWCSADGGPDVPMVETAPGVFELAVRWPVGSRSVSVTVKDGRNDGGRDYIDTDTIEPAPLDRTPPLRPGTIGSNALAIRGWAAKGIRGDQLGPNSGGHRW